MAGLTPQHSYAAAQAVGECDPLQFNQPEMVVGTRIRVSIKK